MAMIGRYQLGRLLGRGGGGAVYEATLLGPGGFRKAVAVKMLVDGTEAIRREARISGLLRHRHLVDVYEIGEERGRWFCAMELCSGGSLAGRGPLPPRAVVEVGLQVCGALDYAHCELGLVHRDLKPDNLLLGDGGVVKVADLGIARAVGFAGGTGIAGTPGYMAPEQSRGGVVDARADIYALGVTLVELATGARPTPGQTLTVGSFDDEPTADASIGVPDWLVPIASGCLAPDPEDRFPHMAALAAALQRQPIEGPGLVEALGLARIGSVAAAPHDPLEGAESDAFLGRADELEALAAWLDAPGPIAIKGPAGIGKSRLAIAAARRWRTRAGAVRVDLADVSTRDGFLAAVAATLGVPLLDADGEGRLGHALAGRGAFLLLLDDADLLRAHAGTIAAWCLRAPGLRIVVTSRAAPGLVGERLLDLGPLDPVDAEALLRDRAAARGVTAEPGGLAGLVAQLEGLPLAIELAAGRLGVLGPADVQARLDQGILRSADPGRHGTLHAALQISWDLLPEGARAALARLTPFAGGFTLESAEAVVRRDGAGSVVDAVTTLIDHSLVRPAGGRFELPQSVRSFAAAIAASPEAHQRHGRHFAALGSDEAIEALARHGGLERHRVLAAERANLLTACRWAIDHADAEVAVGTLRAAWSVLERQGPFAAVFGLLDAVEALEGVTPAQRNALQDVRARACRLLGRGAEARAIYDAQLAACLARGDGRGAAWARSHLGAVDLREGALASARAHAEAGLAAALRHGDRLLEASSRGNLALAHHDAGETALAETSYREALALCRELGHDVFATRLLGNLAILLNELGRSDEAREAYEAARRHHEIWGDLRGQALVLGNLGTVYRTQGRIADARRAHEEALALHRATGYRRGEAYAMTYLASVLIDERRLVEAEARFGEALVVLRELGDRFGEGLTLCNLGILRFEAGRRDEAARDLQAARTLASEIGNRRLHGMVLGEVARAVGGPDTDALLDQALAELDAVGDPTMLAVHHAIRAEVSLGRGDVDAARRSLDRAEAIGAARSSDVDHYVERVRGMLARV